MNQMGLELREESMVSTLAEKPVLTIGVPVPRTMTGKTIYVNSHSIEEVEELTRKGYQIECHNGIAVARLEHEKKPA